MYNVEAEKAIVGYLLMGREEAGYIFSVLHEEHFYSREMKDIFATARGMFEKGEEISAPMLAGKFNPALLGELMGLSCMGHQLENYCKVVRKAYSHRQLIAVLGNAKIDAAKTDEPEQLIGKITEELTGLVLDGRPNYINNRDMLNRVMQDVEEKTEGHGVTGIPTGFPDLDKMIYGLRKKHLVFLAACPKMGKTAISVELITNVASQGYAGLFFSMEMTLEEIGGRQISSAGNIDNTRLQRGNLTNEEYEKLVNVVGELAAGNIGWVERGGLTTTEIKAIARQYKSKHGLDFMVVDQLDKIATKIYPGENKTDAIKRVVVALKQMAQELDCCVLVLCQLLDKVVSDRPIPRPQYGDEKGSSAPAEDADILMYLWRPEFYWPGQYQGMAELIVARQRAGPAGAIWLYWRPKFTKFSSATRDSWPKEIKPG